MTGSLRLYLIILSMAFLVYVLYMVRRGRLLLRYSFTWVVLGVLGVLAALFPNAVTVVSSALSFETPASFLFFTCIFFIMVSLIVLMSSLSRQAEMTERLVQELSLERMDDDGESQATVHSK